MDIHSAEAHIQKVNRYLEDLLKENPSLYTKTRVRLNDLSKELFRGVQLITDILMEDTLMSEDRADDKNLISQDIQSLQTDSSQVQTKISELSQLMAPISGPKSATASISSARKKYIVSNYGRILKSLSKLQSPYRCVNACSELLWKWYNIRFFTPNPGFHYNVLKIPDWIKYIVIAFAKHLSDGTLPQFLVEFNNWLNTAATSDAKQYSVPYEVYNIAQSFPIDYCTTEAIIIWEVLYDSGLNIVNQLKLDEVPLNSETIYNLFNQMNSPAIDRYTYYKDDDAILRQYNKREVYVCE